MVNKQTLSHLLQWSHADSDSSPRDQTLWIKAAYTPTRDGENPTTRIALKLVKLANERLPKIPMISYFCQLNTYTTKEVGFQSNAYEIAETRALTSLIYALIRQLIEKLPGSSLPVKIKSTDIDLSLTQPRFQHLDGTKACWEEALNILQHLVEQIEQPTFCIIDGIQWLEHATTRKSLKKLVGILRCGELRVLYVTTGAALSLGDIVYVAQDRIRILGEQDLKVGGGKEDLGRHGREFWE